MCILFFKNDYRKCQISISNCHNNFTNHRLLVLLHIDQYNLNLVELKILVFWN